MRNIIKCIVIISMMISGFVGANNLKSPNTNANKIYNVAFLQDDFIAQEHFKLIAKEFGYTFKYHTYKEFSEIVDAVRTQPNFLAANITYTDERAKWFNISSPTNIMHTFFYSQIIPFNEAKFIAVPKDTIYAQLIKQQFPKIHTIEYSKPEEALTLVKTNKVDGIIDAIYTLDIYIKAGLNTQVINTSISIPPVSLISSFDIDTSQLESMAAFLQTRPIQSKFLELVEQYKFSLQKNVLMQEIKRLNLDLSEPITVKLKANPEIVNYNKKGEASGITVDVLNELCHVLEANCQIITKKDEPWQNMIQELVDNEFDILGAAYISENSKQAMVFSSAFLHDPLAVVKRDEYQDHVYSDLSELIMERIGVVDDEYYNVILRNALPNKSFVKYKSTDEKIKGLINNEVDYILLDEIDYNLAIRNSNKILPIQIDSYFSHEIIADSGFAFSNTTRGRNLAYIFSRGLDIINTKAIIAKYDIAPNWSVILKSQQRSKMIGYIALFCLLVLITMFVYYQYRRSITDELTRLGNRRALYYKYKNGIKPNTSLIYLDINSFKGLNDTRGHQVGDKALITLANRIKKYWKGDAYRIGGDEFILIGECGEDDRKRLLDNIAKFSIKVKKDIIHLTSSFGTFKDAEKLTELNDAMHIADTEMYEHKKKRYAEASVKIDRRS